MMLVGDTRIVLAGQSHAYLAHVRKYVCFKFMGTDSAFCTSVAVLVSFISKGCLKYCKDHCSQGSNT